MSSAPAGERGGQVQAFGDSLVLERAPFRGPITLKVGNRRCAIDPDLADLVLVTASGPARRARRK